MAKQNIHMTRTWPDGSSSVIQLAPKPLGSGADAKIFPIANDPHTVAKIYHDPDKDPDRQDKIKAMLETSPDLPPIIENGKTYIQIAWPTGIVTGDQGRFLGYAMPFVDLKSSTVLDNLLVKKIRKALKVPEFYGFRVVAAANLAALVESLHALGHHIIDLKPVNLNVYTDSFYVSLLDCDGLSIHGRDGKRYPAHQYTDGFIAPEALRHQSYPRDLGEDQDRFALAVIIFQLLNNGIHPFQGTPLNNASIPPTNGGRIALDLYAYGCQGNPKLGPSLWSLHEYFENETRQLFDRAFGPDPNLRPGACEWRKHLRNLTDPDVGLLKRCSRDPEHGMFSKGCGFCRLQQIRTKIASPGPGKKPMGTQTTQAAQTTQTSQTTLNPMMLQFLQSMPGFNSAQPYQVIRTTQGVRVVQGTTVIQVGPGSFSSPFIQNFFGSSSFPNFQISQNFPGFQGFQNIQSSQPPQKRQAGTPGTAPVVSAGKSRHRWMIWAILGLVAILALLYYFSPYTDVHRTIQENNQPQFFKLVARHRVDWAEVTTEDTKRALAHSDDRIFSAILENNPYLTFDSGIFETLLHKKSEQLICDYIRAVGNFPLEPDAICLTAEIKSDTVATCFLDKMVSSDVAINEFFAAVFLYAGSNMINRIIGLGADPNMDIPIPQDSSTFQTLFAVKTRVNNYAADALKARNCDMAPCILKYCSQTFPIPGMSRIYDLRELKSIIDGNTPQFSSGPPRYESFSGYLAYTAQPLAIAVLKNDLDTIQTLLGAGADPDATADNGFIALGLAQSREAYQILKNHKPGSPKIEPFILADDSSHLSGAVAGMKKREKKAYLKDVMQKAEAIGSVCIINELIKRYKIPFYPKKPTTLIKAYKSGNSMLLGYYLGKGADFNGVYQGRTFFLEYIQGRDSLKNLSYAQRNHATKRLKKHFIYWPENKVGIVLMGDARWNNRWDMAFVLEDHFAKWSPLHFSVLENDVEKIQSILQAKPDKIELRDGRGRTPLALAVQYQCQQSYDALIKHNPDLNAEDAYGYTPLIRAASYGNARITKDLTARGAKLTSKSRPDCSIALAICRKNKELAQLIDKTLKGSSPYQSSLEDIFQTYNLVFEAAGQKGVSICEQ